MKKFTETIPCQLKDSLSQRIFHESALFYDIETTGFSARHNKIYFIGCAFRNGDQVTITQFFSESAEDESLILSSFLELCKKFHSTITFNGLGFDLPFILERCHHFQLAEQLSTMQHLDIFKQISTLKKLFKLPNMKQKSIEQFLGLHREDSYSGGELINVYHDYMKQPEDQKLYLLQLHNKEDVLGMIDILPILSYTEFINGNFEVSEYSIQSYQEYEGHSSLEVVFTLHLAFSLPKRISYGKDDIYISGCGDKVKCKIKIYQGELKYFYSNYKDYYYLPHEDIAIHKSVAFYVDKDFRTKAKAATCYSKKTGRFLPQYSDLFSPYFKLEYHDKISYIEMAEEFTDSKEFQKKYILHILSVLIK